MKQRLLATRLLDKILGTNPIIDPDTATTSTQVTSSADNSNKSPQGEGLVIVGSDVEKLSPSLRPVEAARLTRLAITQSKIKFENIDCKLALRYLYIIGGVELLDGHGLLKFCPKWLGSRKDLISLGGDKSNNNNYWRDTERTFFESDIKKVVAAVVEVGILKAMGTHTYNYNGEWFLQLLGGAIGLRLTAALSNLVMKFFGQTLIKIALIQEIRFRIYFRYVDDSRYGLRPFNPGWRRVKVVGLKFRQDLVKEDSLKSPHKRTTDVMLDLLNSLVEYLRFTPEQFLNQDIHKLPTLDCMVWLENGRILHEYFEKEQTR